MTWETWLLSFLGTLVIEIPVYTWTTRAVFGVARATLVGVALNVATHPLLWVALSQMRHPFPVLFLAAEAVVWAIEAGLLAWSSHTRIARSRLGLPVALGISLAANGFSAGAGLLF